jgi:hypothetical protein
LISIGVFGITLTQYLTSKVQRSFLSAATIVKQNLNQGDTILQSNISKNTTVSNDVNNPIKTNNEAIFANEEDFVKKINQVSEKPVYMKKSKQKNEPDIPIYIQGVPGIISYSKDGYLYAQIITKAQVDTYNLNPNDNYSKRLMPSFDDLITGTYNEIGDLNDLYTVKSSSSDFEFGIDLPEYRINALETQRAFWTVNLSSDAVIHEFNIVGKKGERYFWFKNPISFEYPETDYYESFRLKLVTSEDGSRGSVLKDFLSNSETRMILDKTASELTNKFKFLET